MGWGKKTAEKEGKSSHKKWKGKIHESKYSIVVTSGFRRSRCAMLVATGQNGGGSFEV